MTELGVHTGPSRHRDPRGVQLATKLRSFAGEVHPLPGIDDPAALECLVRQLLDSIRRVEFVRRLAQVGYGPDVSNPASDRFDPLKAAVSHARQGDADEAIWLTFLAVHFGKHAIDGWMLARLVYGRTGEDGLWDWPSLSANLAGFRRWLAGQNATMRGFRFSNHRAYESLAADSPKGTGACVESFVQWVAAAGSFDNLVRAAHKRVGQNPVEAFDAIYREMNVVRRFGRLGKFDFLTMLGKLGLAPIEPGSAYIWDGATGPYRGIRRLATGDPASPLNRRDADGLYLQLGRVLELGMQELEDALCNWQKNPTAYQLFRG